MQRELVERAMAGDHDAFSELARVSIRRLFVIARLILRDDGRAEDASQETLVNAWTHLSALRDPDRFDAWLHRLLVNACYREARRERRRELLEVQSTRSRCRKHPEPPTSISNWPDAISSSAASDASMRISERSS
jgi:RNA polymerase sigma-70 factor (ECF subfamily)